MLFLSIMFCCNCGTCLAGFQTGGRVHHQWSTTNTTIFLFCIYIATSFHCLCAGSPKKVSYFFFQVAAKELYILLSCSWIQLRWIGLHLDSEPVGDKQLLVYGTNYFVHQKCQNHVNFERKSCSVVFTFLLHLKMG